VLKDLFGKRKRNTDTFTVPEAMMPEDPVNYNCVLDYLVGLSKADYRKMTSSAEIYREANVKVAKVIGIKDEPTTSIKTEKPELSDDELTDMLSADLDALQTAFIDEPLEDMPKPKKAQASDKKVEVKAESK
jgi:hypothetical protein